MRHTHLKPIIIFVLRSVVAGLAVAFVLLYFFPGIFFPNSQQNSESGGFAHSSGQSSPFSYNEAVAASAPSVVNIYASEVLRSRSSLLLQDPIFRRFFGNQNSGQQRNIKKGSGVILNPDGYLVTNAHVVSGADEIQVTLIDGRQTKAEVLGTDQETDLALLKIELDSLPAISIGNSDEISVGDVVLAIGNPYDVGQTVTQGIVSARRRNRLLGISTFEDFIQTDADINPGNSGGALINARGELVGINAEIVSVSGGSQGIGFAIPINLVFEVMQQLLEHGRVIRGYLGVTAVTIPKGTLDLNGEQLEGIWVEGVNRGSPAAAAGIIPGDYITEIDNEQIFDIRQAIQIISRTTPGSEIELVIVRGWEEMLVTATVTQTPPLEIP